MIKIPKITKKIPAIKLFLSLSSMRRVQQQAGFSALLLLSLSL